MTRDVSLQNKSRGGIQNSASTLTGDRSYVNSDDFTVRDNRYFSSTNSSTSSLQLALHVSSNPDLNRHHTSPCPSLSLQNPPLQDHISPCPNLNLHESNSPQQHASSQYSQLNATQHHTTQHHNHISPCPKLNLNSPTEHHLSPCPKLNLHSSIPSEHHSGPCPKLNIHYPTAERHSGPSPKLELKQPNPGKHDSGPCPKLNLKHPPISEHHSGPCPKLNLQQSSESEHHSGSFPKQNLHQSPISEHHGPCPKLNLNQATTSEHHKGPCPKLNLGLQHPVPSQHHSGPCPKLNLHHSETSKHHSGPCPKLSLHQTPVSEHHAGPCPKLNVNLSSNMYPQSTVVNSNYQNTSSLFSPATMVSYGNIVEFQMNQKGNEGNIGKLRETIHSGHFMVSDFEPESEVLDEEYEAGMPVPCVTEDSGYELSSRGNGSSTVRNLGSFGNVTTVDQKFNSSLPILPTQSGALMVHRPQSGGLVAGEGRSGLSLTQPQTTIIDGSLTKLFQCMSLAYRQKLTSPKWNPFKGVRLRWKDKIRLNNVIWRCWHMQFILKQRALVCQFASPLDTDQHNKPEAVVMEGKYWKRKLSTVAAEYKKWRLFYRNRIMGWTHYHPVPDLHPVSLDGFDWNRPGTFGGGPMSNIVFDDELLMDFSDTLFSSLSSQPFAFPNPRELSRAGMVADFIQPGLVQLQPNLDDFMDTLEPFHDYVNNKFLPAVPEQIEMDNLDISQDPLMNADLPNLIQSKMQQSQYSKQSNSRSQQGIFPDSDNSGQSMFYSLNQMTEVNNRNSSSSLQNQMLSKDNQKQAGSRMGSAYSSNYRDDMFAIPKGKPRGRSRSGNRNQSSSSHSTFSMAPLTTNPQAPTQSSSSNTHMSHVQMSSTMNNSQTLLSHLLTTPGHGHYASNTGGSSEKSIGANVVNQHVMPQSIPVPGTLIDIQQHQQQPWNPKNAKDTIGSNVSLNFGAKSYSQGSSLGNTNAGPMENSSPTRMTTTPSPPMGPSGSGPPTPPKLFRGKNDNERVFQEHRRVCHINAEQKRRCNIKNGFDMLHSLIPQLSHNPNAKVSKAAMLQKGAEYIRQLKIERGKLKQEIETHRQEVEALNSAINNCQSMLPATGAPVSRQRTNKMKEMFDQWVRMRTLENWKFWLFSILVRPLLDSFNNAVSTSSLDELCRTVLTWIDQHCSLVDLRPAVLNSLRFLCTTTDILTNPSNLPEEATRAVSNVNRQDSNSDMSGSGSSDSR